MSSKRPDTPPLSEKAAYEAAYAWYLEWYERAYEADPLVRERRHYQLPSPNGVGVSQCPARALDVVGGLFDEMLDKIESGQYREMPPEQIKRTGNWLIRRRAVDDLRRGQRERLLEPDAEVFRGISRCDARHPEDQAVETLDARRAMRALSAADRRSLTLDMAGFDGEEQAKALNTSEAAARKRLSRARKRLGAAA